ncbi:glucose PTS transporter subunit IIA [Mycoplasmopsis felifaucium]|uniref:glucose PTS transporter subunit IIA n=1 Tax=Mycoplasmopsis felifaucium TaxID=35768 RepID=UPI0004877B98|nr:glucose PTS transporter subunit IIA [Mycoplasmopsis felifaucium]
MSFREWWKKHFCKSKKQEETQKPVFVSERVRKLVDAFGGINNITGFNNCAARLRYDVKNTALVNEKELKALGATEIIMIGKKHVQAKFGPVAEELNLEIKNSVDTLKKEVSDKIIVSTENFLSDSYQEKEEQEDYSIIYSPCHGLRESLSDLSDDAFSLLGSGYAVKLLRETGKIEIHSPISGKIIVAYPTKHAYGISAPNGLEVLVHIGVDTVKMNGLGFTSNVKLNDEVKHGDVLATVDLNKIKEAGVQSDVIIVITDKVNKNKTLKLLQPLEIRESNLPWLKIVD